MKYLLLLCLVLLCTPHVNCKGGGRGGGGRGGGRRGGGGLGGFFKGIFGGSGKTSSKTHSYPSSSGYSGHGTGGSHSYPSSNGLSGTGQKHGHAYGQKYGSIRRNYVPRVPSYYTSPQYVYVNQYRNSGSRYNTLLLGLIMYNMGRSHSLHHHYYQDSYYRARTSTTPSSNIDLLTTSSPSSTEDKIDKKQDEAICLMRITENEKEDVLKIPCAIVTTFTEGKRKIPEAIGNTTVTVCMNSSMGNSTLMDSEDHYISTYESIELNSPENKMLCKTTIKLTDPLTVTGSPINSTDMECAIEIWTPQKVISNEVDCETLLRYAKMPVPKNKDAVIMPPRSELKEMLLNPPWWLSLFVAV